MPPKLRGKWALGITPRNLTWIIKDKLAICERPGGFGANHRRVRRQEEIIWLRENEFDQFVAWLGDTWSCRDATNNATPVVATSPQRNTEPVR